MTDPTTRELITDLLAALKSWSPTGGGPLEGAEEEYEAALIAKAEAFLDQPEPEGPTDEEILALSQEHGVSYTMINGGLRRARRDGYGLRDDVLSFARAVLARWGRSPQ